MFTRPCKYMKKALTSMLVALMLLASLSACSQSTTTFTDQTPIKIGYSTSLTGQFANDGKALQQGLVLWAEGVNQRGGLLGRPVTLVGLDDGSDPKRVTANYQTLIDKDHVDLLFGPYSSLLTKPAASVAHQHHAAMFAPTGNAPSIFNLHFDNIFVVTLPSKQNLQAFSYYILSLPQSMRPQTAAYVSVSSPFTTPQVSASASILESPEGTLKTVYSKVPYETNANIPQMAKQIAQSKADVVVLGTSGLEDCLSFIKEFKAEHYNPKAIVSTSGPEEGSQFLNALGASTAEGVFAPNSGWYAHAATYQNTQFVQAYVAKYGGSPEDISTTTSEAYSAGQLLEQAVTQTHSLDNATLIKALHTNVFNSLQGPLRFDPDGGNTIGIPTLFQWLQGQFVPVYPFTNAQANPEYPKSTWS
ncbi:binding-protein-dependent transporter [Ktedonobacter sp. SOSP1-52]|nr:binding-protein-dependent transporter [Ktedonobacter sp. SOSP1-52]